MSRVALSTKSRRLLVFGAVSFAAMVDVWLFTLMPGWMPGTDLFAAWSVDLADPWKGAGLHLQGAGVYRHSPAVAQLAALIGWIPWLWAQLLFLAVQLTAIVLMAGRRWPYVVLFPGVFWNLYFANVDLLMGAAIVAGFRYPGTWAFLFLTKITPGTGVLWFAFRQEWRKFVVALGATALIVAVSFVLAPHLWFAWFEALRAMSALPQANFVPPLLVRIPIALIVVWYAARSGRRWLVPVACLIAVPNPWFVTWAVLGGSVALWGRDDTRTLKHSDS